MPSSSAPKVLILISDTGGGHRASAEAIRMGFAEAYGDRFEVSILDPLAEYAPWPLNKLRRIYFYFAQHAPETWKFMWQMTQYWIISSPSLAVQMQRLRKPMEQALADHKPDMIICVHPLVQQIFSRVLKRIPNPPLCATVVTDPVRPHRLWFHMNTDLCFVATESGYAQGQRFGLLPAQLRQYGLPINPAFSRPPRTKATLRQELGMDAELPAVLLISGGDGVGPVERIASRVVAALDRRGAPMGQLVIICGRNRLLRHRLSARRWPIPTRVNGFVSNMPEWMAACDCIITKAGPGTIAEAQAMGLPIILSGFIPGQEQGNVEYVLENEVGQYSERPREIARMVHRWFVEDRAGLEQASQNALRISTPNATFDIVREIVQQYEARSQDPPG